MNKKESSEFSTADIDLSLVLPFYNERESLPEVCKSLIEFINQRRDIRIEVIFVDDASTDGSLGVIESFNWVDCKVLQHYLNLGHQQALFTGLSMARGKFIGMMDSDGQHPVCEIFKMFEIASSERWDLVQGVRISRTTDRLFKRVSARLFYFLMRIVSSVDVTTDASDFRVLSRRCSQILLSLEKPLPFRFSLGQLNVKKILHNFEVSQRIAGDSKYSIQKMNSLAISSLTSFSDKPLRFVASLGISSSLASIMLVLLIGLFAVIGMTIPGWASLAVLISVFGALNLLSAGIIALYLSMAMERKSGSSRNVELIRVFNS
jgi:dolichol-phosphate mannosyltransferase